MNRFQSISSSPYETRRILRDRLNRMLRPSYEPIASASKSGIAVTDVELLELLVRVRVGHSDDVEKVRTAYEAHRNVHPDIPDFDALIADGWFGVTWGRITEGLSLRRSIQHLEEPLRTGLQLVFDAGLNGLDLAFDDVTDLSLAAQQLAVQLTEHPEQVSKIPSKSPDWITARLWERRPQICDVAALRWWVDRCHLLGHPSGSPSKWWSDCDARIWRSAATDVLCHDSGLVAWDREKALIDAQICHERGSAPTSQLPSTLIDRYLWNNGFCHELDPLGRALYSCGDTWILLNMLCEDLVAHDRILKDPSAAELLNLIVERPILLVLFVGHVQRRPALLADLLLHPTTSALACLMIADWTAQPISAFDRPLQDAENAEARERAFADAMAIMSHHIRSGVGSIEELGALLVWIHEQARRDDYSGNQRPRRISDRMFKVVRSELQTLSRPQLEILLTMLSFRESDGLGQPRFTAALDVATLASLSDVLDSDSLVSAYVATLCSNSAPDVIALTPTQAATLVRAAQRSTIWNKFLAPFDVKERVARSEEAENKYILRFEIARSLRAHIRLLARAIAAWDEEPPNALIDALACAIRNGSCDHFEKGRIGAFNAQYEARNYAPKSEPPLVNDIATACKRLSDTSRRNIDDALRLIDEPLALANLCQSAPTPMQEMVRSRIDELNFDDAAKIYSLVDLQKRIDELLNAGATIAAAKHMDVERDMKTCGPVPGRQVRRLQWELRLALLKKDFPSIEQKVIPEGLSPSEIATAQDTINFYKGIAEFERPNGSASAAEALFADLSRRNPHAAAYVVNLFSARLSKLLENNCFMRLDGNNISVARKYLNEADLALNRALGVGEKDRAIHDPNKALLLLAMGQNVDAYEILQRAKAYGESDRLAAYSAVALARMGRLDEAHTCLAVSESIHVDSDVLKAARDHLELDRPSRFRVLSVDKDENVAAIQSALFQLKQIDPSAQARVVARNTMEAHITHEIRSAAAGVTAVVPMMRGIELKEDDISDFLQYILSAGVRFFDWSVSDQSMGGYSAKGNPGKRDLVLRKNGYVITVIEAVICKSNPLTDSERINLIKHFQKLFGYDQCNVFYLVVYSYLDMPAQVVEVMRGIAESSAPSAFAFSCIEDLPHEDSRPIGFVATYKVPELSNVKVICLVMDMRQQKQRDAAALAGNRNQPRAAS